MAMKPDEDLLSKLKSGDLKAYEELFKRHYHTLCLQAFYMLNDEMEAEDLVQNLFISFWQDRRFSQVTTSLKNYLQRAVHNRCLNVLAKRKSDGEKFVNYAYIAGKATTDEGLEPSLLVDQMQGLLLNLPQQQRRAVHLVHLEDKRYEDAASEMGISINSVKTHLRLAFKMLRSIIKQ